jgi:tetratricopeptide (TPR) repeat protein
MLFSLVPGWGHVYWGREALGIGIFSAAALVGFGFLNAWLVYQGSGKTTMVWVFGVIFCLVMVASWIDIFLRTEPARVSEDDRRRKLCLERGTASYLQGDLAGALGEFRECLKIEPNCPEALFRIGVLAVRQDDFELARTSLRRALRYDIGEKWKWEIQREFTRLDAGISAQEETSFEKEAGAEPQEEPYDEETPEREEEAEHASA